MLIKGILNATHHHKNLDKNINDLSFEENSS